MGTSGSALCERVKSSSESELTKYSKEDDEVALIAEELFQPSYLSRQKDLAKFDVPLFHGRGVTGESSRLEEVKFSVVHSLKEKVHEKHADLCRTIQEDIAAFLQCEEDPDFRDLLQKLQMISRTQMALLRQEERERRRLQKSSQISKEKQLKKKKQLPIPAKIGLEFGLLTLLDLVKIIGADRRAIFGSVMRNATGILTQLPPLCLALDDTAVMGAVETFNSFLEDVIRGKVAGPEEEDKLASLAALLGLALAKGSLASVLAVTQKLLGLSAAAQFAQTFAMLSPLLKTLSEIEGSCIGKRIFMNWNPGKLGPDIALSNDNTTVTRTDSSGWGCQLTEQSLTSGVHYYEFKIDRNNSSCLLLGCVGAAFSNFNSKCSGANCYTLQADGDAYMNDRGAGNVFRYGEGDRLGVLVNMEDKNLAFFLNGKKQGKPHFPIASDEVYLIACFGGSNQFVTLINDPDIPDEAQEALGHAIVAHQEEEKKEEEVEEEEKAGEEAGLFPSTPAQVLKASRFARYAESSADPSIASPRETAVYLLNCLEKLNDSYFSVFKLNEKPSSEPIKAKLNKQQPLCLEIKPEVFHMLYEMLETVYKNMKNESWEEMDFQLSVLAIIPVLRILRSHLFTVLFLQLGDEDTGIDHSLRDGLYHLLQDYLELHPSNFGNENPTKEDLDGLALLKKETSLTLIHGFEVFYPSQTAKLEYINQSLSDTIAKKKLHDVHVNIQQLVFDKMSIPVNLSDAFTLDPPETMENIWTLLNLLLDICGDYSYQIIQGNETRDHSYYLRFLHSAQKVLLSKAGREDFVGPWQDLLIRYTLQVLKLALKLLESLRGVSNGEEVAKNTVLGSLVSSLLLVLCLAKHSQSCIIQMMLPLMNVINALSSLGYAENSKYPKTVQLEDFESAHPYEASQVLQNVIEVENAEKYVLVFDATSSLNHASLELFYDEERKNRVYIWENADFPTEPLTINAPKLYFTFTSDAENSDWGFKISIQAEVNEKNVQKWHTNLQSVANFLVVLFSKRQIMGDFESEVPAEVTEVMSNVMFKYGIKDKCHRIIDKESRSILDEGLIDLSIIPGAVDSFAGAPPLVKSSSFTEKSRRSSLPGLKVAKPNVLISLSSYIATFSTLSAGFARYSEISAIEQWITGDDAVHRAWETLKKEANIPPIGFKIGGNELDQAERALFAVFASFFGFADQLESLIEDPQEVGDDTLKFLVNQTCHIRKWAQKRKQEMIDQGQNVEYSEINTDIVQKCVILLHTEFSTVLEDLGVHKISVNIIPYLGRSATTEPSVQIQGGLKRAKTSISKLRTLIKLMGTSQERDGEIQPNLRKEFNKVNELIMTLMNAQVSMQQFFQCQDEKRNKALQRVVGLNYMIHMLKMGISSKSQVVGQIVRMFSEAFRNTNGTKNHYLEGLEGVDSALQTCVRKSFFSLYSILLSNLRLSFIKDVDTTSPKTSHTYLKLFEALSFPFEESDAPSLLELNMLESLNFLLAWIKGQKINERITYKFNPKDCITSIRVHNEEEFMSEGNMEGVECFSLNTVNRLEGECGQEEEDNSLKLCLEIVRGENALPITDIVLGHECPEGYTPIEGNVNEQGEPLFLFVRREEPREQLQFLQKIEVTQNNPLCIKPVLQAYQQYLVKDQAQEETEKRANRRKNLRKASWGLLKHLLYTCAGEPDAPHASPTRQIKKFKLQSLFTEMLFEEIVWVKTKEVVDTSHNEFARLRLKKLSGGDIWIESEICKPKFNRNPMVQWISKFREEFTHLVDTDCLVEELMSFIEEYINSIDPSMKGVLSEEEVRGMEDTKDLLDNQAMWNSRGELDFFCILNHFYKEILEEPENSQIVNNHLFIQLPVDFHAASEEMCTEVPKLLGKLMEKGGSSAMFPLLKLFSEQSDLEKLGIVPKGSFPDGISAEFLNTSGDLDFFALLNAVLRSPQQFPDLHAELKALISSLDELPGSVEEVLMPQRPDSSAQDYVGSLLWVLFQTCSSNNMKRVLGSSKYVEELLKHMLFGASETIIVVAFRIFKSVVPSQHSPQSFAAIWAALPKHGFDKVVMDETLMDDWLDTFLFFAGRKHSYFIQGEREVLPKLSKLCAWSYEAADFLRAACLKEAWRQEIVGRCVDSLRKLTTSLEAGDFAPSYGVGLGALSFLYSCCGQTGGLDKAIQEWSFVSLKGGSLPQGYAISVNNATKKLKIYSTEDDAVHEESLNNLDSMVSLHRPQIFAAMPADQSAVLFTLITTLIQFIKEHDALPVVEDVQVLHSLRAVWRQMENLSYQLLSTLCSARELFSEAEANALAQSIFERVAGVDSFDPLEQSLRLRSVKSLLYSRHKHKALGRLKDQEDQEIEICEEKPIEDVKVLSEEEEGRIISELKDEEMILVVSLKSLGYEFRHIEAAMKAGKTDITEIESWIAQRREAEERRDDENKRLTESGGASHCVYKLKKEEDNLPLIIDHSGIAYFEERENGLLVITAKSSLDEKKYMKKHVHPSVLRAFHEFSPEVTLYATVGVLNEQPTGIFGLTLGSLEITLDCTGEETHLMVDQERAAVIPKSKNYSFELHATFNGSLQLALEGSEFTHELVNLSVYDGLNIGDFGIFLRDGDSAVLKGFALFLGHYTGKLDYWQDTKPQVAEADAKQENAKLVSISVMEHNQTALRLKSIGCPRDLAQEFASRYVSFDRALDALLLEFNTAEWEEAKPLKVEPPIVEVVLVDSQDDIEEGFTPAPTLLDGEEVDNLFLQTNRRILCYKKHSGPYFPGNVVTNLYIGNPPKEQEATPLGPLNFTAEDGNENPVHVLNVSKSKLNSRQPLTSIKLLATKNPDSLIMPIGFKLAYSDGKAVNIAPPGSEHFVFVAYSENTPLMDFPVTPLVFSKVNVTEYGLVDHIEQGSPEANIDKLKKIEEEIVALSSSSLVELQSHLKHIDNIARNISMKSLFLQIIQKYPSTLAHLLCSKPENFFLLFNLLKENKNVLETSILKVLEGSKGPDMAHILLKECILQLVLSLTCSPPSGKLNEQLIESQHPYENSMRNDQTIRIPGASALRIEFDPQCHTESGCDILRFFRQPNHAGQICELSGRSFPDFEVEGDTVYLYFYSDASCVEWGYKFKVIPIEHTSASAKDPLANRLNVDHALWVLENIVSSYQEIPLVLHRFLGKEMINPLTLYVHSSKDMSKQERGIRILQTLLKKQVEIHPAALRVVSLIAEETRSLYHFEKNNKAKSSLLQKLLCLVIELKHKFEIKIDERWFHEICDAFALMKGFCKRDHNIYPVLFEQFKCVNNIKLEKFRESNHPYQKRFSTKEISLRGASFMEIEFDEKSKLDPQDALLLTYDREGLRPVEDHQDCALVDAFWFGENRGPDIVFSNNNRSVTRTNSSGWGCAIWSEIYSQGTVKINFSIDNDGRSDYLYIGIFKADGNYRFNEVINSDNSHELWTWKTTGEFHKRGDKVTVSESRYRTGDNIALLINMEEKTMTCSKNGNDYHTFTNIADEVIPVICFGGSNQHVTITSVESFLPLANKISKKRLSVNGDQVFFHFPVNNGYILARMHNWKKIAQGDNSIQYSKDMRKLRTVEGMPPRLTLGSRFVMQTGKHYCSFMINRISPDDKIQIGITPEGLDKANPINNKNSACYQADGTLYINSAERPVPPLHVGDEIGICLDFEKSTVQFFIRGQEVAGGAFVFEPEKGYVFAVSFDAPNQKVYIQKNADIPESIDLIGARRENAPEAREWGYKFKVTPFYTGENKMRVIESLNETQQKKWEVYKEKHINTITKSTEEQLVQFIEEFCISKDKDLLKLDAEEINPTKEELRHYLLLEPLSVNDLRDIFKMILFFNRQVEKILPLVSLDLQASSREGLDELQSLFLNTRGYIFYVLKNEMFNIVLNSTKTDSRCEISIDRTKALKSKATGKIDSQGLISVFSQIYRAINNNAPRNFRNPERIFKVVFRGEGSTDAGGPYNEAISTICEELMSRYLPLFVPTQNNVHNVGENRDSWIINPMADSPLQLDQFQFLGKLIGVAIRTSNNLGLSLPPLFWKRLMLEEVGLQDLKAVDECCYQMLEILRNLDANGITPENFQENFENMTFTVTDSSGRSVELLDGGREIPITYGRALEYVGLVEKLRLYESSEQYAAIRKGMSIVVPLNLLNLFSWKQVEIMVCGAPDIDIDLLMSKTDYENLTEDAPHVKYFWSVLRSITPKDRSHFLRFVWGRSKLPSGRNFKKFKITQLNKAGNPDNYLPVAHTCFFQLDIPAYSSQEIMREKLLYAITHCQAIDLDRVAEGGWED